MNPKSISYYYTYRKKNKTYDLWVWEIEMIKMKLKIIIDLMDKCQHHKDTGDVNYERMGESQ